MEHLKAGQVGCGYCDKEKTCLKHDPKVNKAKAGCTEFLHFTDGEKWLSKNQK